MTPGERARSSLPAAVAVTVAIAAAARLAHAGVLWAEEAYPTAAARELASGKVLYRDIWFDKPPLYAFSYLLWGSHTGVALRCAGALYLIALAGMAWRFARDLWGREEAAVAACFSAVYFTFGIPSAVMALAPDLLMALPHLAAVYLAWAGWPLAAGMAAGLCFGANAKGVLVLAVCLLWRWREAHRVLAGFALPTGAMALYLAANGAWHDYARQVWEWGWVYAGATFVEHPWREGFVRTMNWVGFQAAAVVGTAWFFLGKRERADGDRWRMALWLLAAGASVAAGWRFFPRYYFAPLVAVCILGARGVMLMPVRARVATLALLLIPVIRFGPRYATLAADEMAGRAPAWSDLAMQQDSLEAAAVVRALARPGDTLLVWGYRCEIYPYTGLHTGTRFLDSQPLTGVLADRHLTTAEAAAPEWAEQNRRQLIQTQPTFIVDGLGPYNPALAIAGYADLRSWLAGYERVGGSAHAIMYQRRK